MKHQLGIIAIFSTFLCATAQASIMLSPQEFLLHYTQIAHTSTTPKVDMGLLLIELGLAEIEQFCAANATLTKERCPWLEELVQKISLPRFQFNLLPSSIKPYFAPTKQSAIAERIRSLVYAHNYVYEGLLCQARNRITSDTAATYAAILDAYKNSAAKIERIFQKELKHVTRKLFDRIDGIEEILVESPTTLRKKKLVSGVKAAMLLSTN